MLLVWLAHQIGHACREARALMRSLQVYHVIRKLHEDLEEGAVDGAGVRRQCVCFDVCVGVWQVTMAHST